MPCSQSPHGYRASYDDYEMVVELREDGWYWLVKDKKMPYPHDQPKREADAEEAKKAAVLCVGILSGRMTLGNSTTLGDIYSQIVWKES